MVESLFRCISDSTETQKMNLNYILKKLLLLKIARRRRIYVIYI